MGMFDTFYVNCPICGNELDIQNKSGPCELKKYSISTVPPSVAGSLHGEVTNCCGCGTDIEIVTQCVVSVIVKRDEEDEECY